MNKAERQELILNKLKVDHHVYISDLCQELDTSYDSIRRDITELDAAGKLKRVHGGAIAKGGLPLEYVNRSDLESNAKQQLAHKAIELFHDGDILLIDGGTSNVELVRQLPSDMHFTIFTNSLPVATEFCDIKNLEIHLLGGTVFAQSRITIGATVAEALQAIHADWYSLGICAIDPYDGITDFDYEDCIIKRAMVKASRQRIVMADSSKLNTSEAYVSAQLSEIDFLIVEDKEAERIRKTWPKNNYHIL